MAIVGAGRLGTALTRALRSAGYPAVIVPQSRAGWQRARNLRLPTLEWIPVDAELMFLCVPDAKIREVCDTLVRDGRVFPGRVYAHCAGAVGLSALSSAARFGAHLGSLHPMTSVPSAKAALAGAWACVDGDSRARRALTQVAKDLGMHPFRLRRGQRPAYHAAAALASNGLVALAHCAASILVRAGLPRTTALHALFPLMGSAMTALKDQGLPGALTGPVARHDVAIVEAHLRSLRGEPEVREVYRSLTASAARIAEGMRGADRAALRKIRKLVGGR